MPIGQEVKEIQQFDWWRERVWPLNLHTSAQSPKAKGLQSIYMTIFFGIFGAKSFTSWQKFGHMESRNPNSCQKAKHFFE